MKKLSKPHGMIAQRPAPPTKIKAPPTLKENSPKIETKPLPHPPAAHQPTGKPEPIPNPQQAITGHGSQGASSPTANPSSAIRQNHN